VSAEEQRFAASWHAQQQIAGIGTKFLARVIFLDVKSQGSRAGANIRRNPSFLPRRARNAAQVEQSLE